MTTGLFCLVNVRQTPGVFFQSLSGNPAISVKQHRFEFTTLADGVLVHWRSRRNIKPSSRVYFSVIFVNRMASLRKGWNPVQVPGNFVGIVTPVLAPKLKGVCGMCSSPLNLRLSFSKQLKKCLWIYKFTRMDIKIKERGSLIWFDTAGGYAMEAPYSFNNIPSSGTLESLCRFNTQGSWVD